MKPYKCSRCGVAVPSVSAEDYPDGGVWCAECEAKAEARAHASLDAILEGEEDSAS